MIGILVLSHGNLSQSVVETGKMIVGSNPNVDYLGLYAGDNIDEFYKNVTERIKALNDGDGVLVFSDLYGASPFKSTAYAVKKLANVRYRSVSGINFPMFIESILVRESKNLDELAEHVMSIGKEGIKELFNEAQKISEVN